MDKSDIEKVIAQADRRALYLNQVEHAKERYRALNVLYWEGHAFELTPGFITYVLLNYMSNQFGSGPVVLLDKNEEPVRVEKLSDFVDRMEEIHTEALNDYEDTYQRLKLARDSEELIEVA